MKNYKFKTGENIFFTSDTHFFHNNIIKFCNRPFSSVEEMNETLIKNWNDKVPKDGIVFHLGDFAFCGSGELKNIVDRLNGKIYLTLGNHDRKIINKYAKYMFADVNMQYYIRIENTSIYLNHLPFLCYDGTYRKENYTWQLFGHVHSSKNNTVGKDNERLINLFPMQLDVGVDNWNYTPVSFNEVKERINEQIKKAL